MNFCVYVISHYPLQPFIFIKFSGSNLEVGLSLVWVHEPWVLRLPVCVKLGQCHAALE